MNVSYIANTRSLGGAERYLLTLTGGIRDCRIFMPAGDAAREVAERAPWARVELLPTDGYSIRPSSLARSMRFFRGFRDGIIHFNLSHPCASTVDILAARLVTHCPIFVTTHLPTVAEGRREKISSRVALRAAHRVIAVCGSARDYLVSEKVKPEKVVAIYNGISDLQTPALRTAELKSEMGITAADLVVGIVARLEPQKGLDIILRAFQSVLQRCPFAMLVVAGGGSQESSLKKLASELGIAPRVRFLGWRSDSREVMSAFDLFALPSLFESFPFTVVEAMMAGKPIVGSNVGGVAEAVVHGETGLLIEPGDEDGLKDALLDLLPSEVRRLEMGRLGRERAQALFSAESMVAATRGLYEQVLSNARTR